jgi:Sporulation and spore germination
MPRDLKIALGILAVAVAVGLISLRGLHRRMQGLAESQSSDEKARREVLAPEISTPSDVPQGAKIFWAAGEDRVTATTVELALSADPVQRGKQALEALIADTPSPEQRTIPADSELLAFYILSDGTAIADFSDALSSETPSGIESEQLVVDSIARTLENNVPTAHRLKILIHGQEAETLAGHVDLTGFFDLNPPNAALPVPAPSSAAPPVSAPASVPAPPKTLSPGGAPKPRR